jgi:unsaturated rhamnogalacturonyl hydrolase
MKKNFLFLLCMTLHILSFGQSDTWSVKFSDAIHSRYQPTINAMTNKGWEYSNGIILHGMEKVYNWTNDVRYFNYIKAYVDTYVDASGNITGLGKTVDKIQPGVLCLFLYEKTGELKYKTAATNLVNYMYDNFYKTPDGGFWHKSEQNTTSYTYYHVMMVDGMYMLHPFLTKYAHMFNQPSLYDEATFQLLFLASKVMYSPRTLPKHAWEYYDYKTWSSSTTHESTDVWSRGTGWYIMALADVLEFLPTSHANYSAVLELFQRMASGVAANQHPTSGLWYQVVDKRTETGNWTESSGSGMFVYALKKGVDNGWLDAATYTPVINKGWEGMKTQIGTLADGPQIKQFCVASGVVNNTAAYYSLGKTNCPTSYPWSGTQHPHGYCGILMAASAMEFPIATVPVTGVILSPSSAILSVGETQQLTATVSPTNATNRAVTWSSSNTGVATVSSAGLVTGSGAGTAVITAKTSDGGFTAISTVTVTAVTPCTTIQNQAESGTYTSGTTVDSNYSGYTGTGFVNTPNTVGSYLQITVTALIAGTHDFNVRFANGTTTNRTVSVSVNGTTVIASLSMAGTGAWSTWSTSAFSASLVAGTNTIRFTALTSGGLANIDRVDMCQKYIPATGVLVSPASVTLTPGGKQQLTASVQPANASYPSVTWSSGNTGVATVNSSGLITAVTSGTTVITATTGNGLTSSAQVTVSSIPVTGVTVNPALTLLKVGDQSALTAIIEPANATNQNVTWNSSNTSVATVSSSGVVTALAEGTANITVTTADGNFTSVCPVTSYLIHITGISVTPSTAAITVGENITLTASVTPTDANNLNYTWSTSNNDIATVSSTGVVTGIAAGTAMITATTQDGGYTSNCEVTVSNIPVTGVNVSRLH